MSKPHLLTPAEIARMTEVAARLGPWSMPVIDALREGLLSVVMLRRGQRAPLADMRRSRLPVLAWLGDDDDHLSTGPDGWRCALPAIRWARSAMVHAAGGESRHYALAAGTTILTGRFLLVETQSRFAEAWAGLLQGTPTMCIVPRDGAPHPVAYQGAVH